MSILLWIIQVLLALLFLFAGSMKFIMPVEEMNRQAPVVLPGYSCTSSASAKSSAASP